MANVSDKGVNVMQWIASILVSMLIAMVTWTYNQQSEVNKEQSKINKEMLDLIWKIRQDMSVGDRDETYLREKIQKMESANEKLEQENEQQQDEINELKRYHR